MEFEDDYKIWYPHEVFYIESMLTITRNAVNQISNLNSALSEWNDNNRTNEILIIDYVQNIINSSAALSRYFWPARTYKVHKRRAQRLREIFNVLESNPLENRDVRNSVEHFDEKLDNYLKDNFVGTFYPYYIALRRPTDNNHLYHFFRAYFIDEEIFCVLNDEYNIRPIINEIYRIHLLLKEYK